jgi:hypothetical protein
MKDTFELYFETMADVLLDPSLIVYYDFEAIEGTYAALSIGENVAVGKGMDLQMRIRLGVGTSAFNKGFFRLEAIKAGKEDEFSPDSGAVDMSSAIKVVIPVQERVTIVPCFEYTSLLDSDLRDIVKEAGKKADNAIGSLMISWSF